MGRVAFSLVSLLFFGLNITQAFAQTDDAHSAILKVSKYAEDTPGNKGYLEFAEETMAAAFQYAALAVANLDDEDALKRNLRLVRETLEYHRGKYHRHEEADGDATVHGFEAVGYAAATIKEASKAEGASEAVLLHAKHIETSLINVIDWSLEAYLKSIGLLDSNSDYMRESYTRDMLKMLNQALNGVDANGDGIISWERGEGGLAQARQHLSLLLEAEGIE